MGNRNRFGSSRKRRRGVLGIILPPAFFVAVVAMFNMGVNYLTRANEEEALEAARNAVTRAAVQFYALEGRYPPTLEYLVDRFGLQLDEERFIIHYNAYFSNVMPQIAVLPREF
ncbi:MAG: hypothetical protein FWE20_03035 [Defluviitaleaceae bacterium]|nr:hypothetical protein [Defluviitaleaceae bacterium]